MAKYSDFWDKQVVDKPIATNYKGGTYTTGLQNAIATPKLSYSEFLKANVGNGGAVASSFPTSQQTNYGNILSSYQMPTQTAPKVNYGEVDLETGGTTVGAHTDRRGRQFPLNNNETGGAYTDNIDKYSGSLETQRQQALNQIEVNRQLGKSTYGVTAEQLGQAGLTGSGYAQFLDSQNEAMAEEAKKGLDTAEVKAKEELTFTLTDGDGKSQTLTTDSLEAIDKYISEGTITSAEELKTIRNAFAMSDEEYTARATAIYDKNYAPLAKEYDTVSAGSDNAAVESLFGKIDSEYAQGKISQSQYQDLYFKDNKQSIEDLVASQNVAEVKRGINIDKSKLGDTKYNELIKLLEEKEKSLLKNEQRQSSIIANSIDGGGTSRGAAGLDIAKKIREWFESLKK